jgi:LmbE family N-acetylglucosaminyl deacetylase
MQFHMPSAEIFIPSKHRFGAEIGGGNEQSVEAALGRTTHMAIAAHQDDIEIMAAGPILECFQKTDLWFSGVVLTDGRGSPRSGLYEQYSDEEMRLVRFAEQRKAAVVGEYAAQVMLDYPSRAIKDGGDQKPVEDIAALLRFAHPRLIYTHNLADKHDTHVGVALKVIAAIRSLPEAERPEKLYGCEVWRDLDWMVDKDKVAFDLTAHESLQMALLGVFDSQIAGGKRYDLATMGRRRAHATYYESHGVDLTLGMAYAMDLTPLIADPALETIPFVQEFIRRFAEDVADRLKRLA